VVVCLNVLRPVDPTQRSSTRRRVELSLCSADDCTSGSVGSLYGVLAAEASLYHHTQVAAVPQPPQCGRSVAVRWSL